METLEQVEVEIAGWTEREPMPLARSYAASGVIDGRIYCVGGGVYATAPDEKSKANQCYDPSGNFWKSRAPMPTGRHWAGGAVVNGKLHVIGGGAPNNNFLTTHEVYDPATDSWQTLKGLPTGRTGVKVAVVNGRIHALGGSKPKGAGAGPCPDHTVYDPSTGDWTVLTDMPEPKLCHAVAALGGKIYVFGDSKAAPKNYVYDTATKTWSEIAPCPQLVGDAGVATIGGKIYLVGGTQELYWGAPLDLVQVYDPAKNQWKTLPEKLSQPRQALVAAAVGNVLYAIGGAIFNQTTFAFNSARPNTGVMKRIGAVDLNSSGPLNAAVMDPQTGHAFLAAATLNQGSVLKVKLGNLSNPPTLLGKVTITPPEESFYSGVMAAGFAWFGNVGSYVVQINPGPADRPPTREGSLQLLNDEKYLTSAVVDEANGYAYFGTTKEWPGHIVKVKLEAKGATRVSRCTLSDGAIFAKCGAIDAANGFAYFGTGNGRVVKVALGAGANPPTQQGVLELHATDGNPVSAVLAAGFAYFGTNASPGRVVQVRLSDFKRVGALTLESEENNLTCAVVDPADGHAYFGTATGYVVKVALGDQTNLPARIGSLKLQPEETDLKSAVIDTAQGFACFATGAAFTNRFVKVDLGG